jgi:hypothetical protein
VLTVVPDESDGRDDRTAQTGPIAGSSLIDEIVREGARRMVPEALAAEVDAYIAQFTDERDERGRRLVVRNGSHQPREVLTSAGAVQVVVRGHAAGQRRAHRPGHRRTDAVLLGDPAALVPQDPEGHRGVAASVPARAVHQRLAPALGQFLGSSAGLSARVITRLIETWKSEQRAFAARDLSQVDSTALSLEPLQHHHP